MHISTAFCKPGSVPWGWGSGRNVEADADADVVGAVWISACYLENFEGMPGRSDGEPEGRTSPQTENTKSQNLRMLISTLSAQVALNGGYPVSVWKRGGCEH